MAHTYVTLVHRNYYNTLISDMLLEVCKTFGTEGVKGITLKALSILACMPVGHYQLFKFSLASEAVLPDNRIILLLSPTHFRSCPPLPFPPCVLERVMGTVFAR